MRFLAQTLPNGRTVVLQAGPVVSAGPRDVGGITAPAKALARGASQRTGSVPLEAGDAALERVSGRVAHDGVSHAGLREPRPLERAAGEHRSEES